jgi:hypothetical protein
MLEASFELKVATLASSGVGHNRHGGIETAGGQDVPVGAKRHTEHVAGGAGQALAQRAWVRRVGEVPQPDGVIGAAAARLCPVVI